MAAVKAAMNLLHCELIMSCDATYLVHDASSDVLVCKIYNLAMPTAIKIINCTDFTCLEPPHDSIIFRLKLAFLSQQVG